jgi:Na+-driven multidrug efflux pump
MIAAGAVLFFVPRLLARIFVSGDQTEVIELIAELLPVAALSMPALAVVSILGGALRGAGDTRWPLVFTFIGLLLIRIPGSYWLAYDSVTLWPTGLQIEGMGWGVLGAWYAMVADLVLRCVLVLGRFFQGGWKRIIV